MLPPPHAIGAKPLYEQVAEREVERREQKIYTQRRPSVLAGQLLQPLADGEGGIRVFRGLGGVSRASISAGSRGVEEAAAEGLEAQFRRGIGGTQGAARAVGGEVEGA